MSVPTPHAAAAAAAPAAVHAGAPLIDWTSPTFHHTLLLVLLAPLIWNTLARTIRATLPASTARSLRYIVCYALTIWVFSFSTYRDF